MSTHVKEKIVMQQQKHCINPCVTLSST